MVEETKKFFKVFTSLTFSRNSLLPFNYNNFYRGNSKGVIKLSIDDSPEPSKISPFIDPLDLQTTERGRHNPILFLLKRFICVYPFSLHPPDETTCEETRQSGEFDANGWWKL